MEPGGKVFANGVLCSGWKAVYADADPPKPAPKPAPKAAPAPSKPAIPTAIPLKTHADRINLRYSGPNACDANWTLNIGGVKYFVAANPTLIKVPLGYHQYFFSGWSQCGPMYYPVNGFGNVNVTENGTYTILGHFGQNPDGSGYYTLQLR